MKPHKGTLNNWYMKGTQCVGDLENGTTIITSLILSRIYDVNRCVGIITLNSRYDLGKKKGEQND